MVISFLWLWVNTSYRLSLLCTPSSAYKLVKQIIIILSFSTGKTRRLKAACSTSQIWSPYSLFLFVILINTQDLRGPQLFQIMLMTLRILIEITKILESGITGFKIILQTLILYKPLPYLVAEVTVNDSGMVKSS